MSDDLGYSYKTKRAERSGGRRGAIGVVVAALHNSFYPYLVDRLHNEFDDLGFDMVLIIDEITATVRVVSCARCWTCSTE